MSFIKYPTGSIVPMAAASLNDTSWIPCDGSLYNGNDARFADLWSVIGTTYGGTGISSFAVPHLGGRIPAGQTTAASGTGIDGPAGSWSGSTSVTLTAAQSGRQAHSHTLVDPGHTHTTSTTHTHNIFVTATTAWVGTYQSYEIIRYDTDSKGLPVAVYGYVTRENSPTGYIEYPVDWSNGTSNIKNTQDQTPSITLGSASVSITANSIGDVAAAEAHENTMPVLRLHYLIKL